MRKTGMEKCLSYDLPFFLCSFGIHSYIFFGSLLSSFSHVEATLCVLFDNIYNIAQCACDCRTICFNLNQQFLLQYNLFDNAC